jgi:ketosteroid isomerase-like protein
MSGATDGIADRIRRLEDRFEIDDLIARYGMIMDDRDIAAMPDLFTEDVVIRSRDGGMAATGRDAAVAMYGRRLTALGPSNHFTHDRVITFVPGQPDQAQGIVLSHAEMSLKGAAMLAAIRYHDRYRRDGGRWRFSERELTFMYFVRVAEYLDALGPGLANRNRVFETPRPADWPEQLASWKQYYGDSVP